MIKLTIAQMAKKFITFYGTRKFNTVHKMPPLTPCLRQLYPVNSLTNYLTHEYIFVANSYLHITSQVVSALQVSD
jgi:hypothetical protein